MNQLLRYFAVCAAVWLVLAGVNSVAVAAKAAKAAKARKGALAISCSEKNAVVYLDGRVIGTTPLKPRALLPGRYRVTISKDGFVRVDKKVRIRSNRTVRLVFEMQLVEPELEDLQGPPELDLELVPLSPINKPNRAAEEELELEPLTPAVGLGAKKKASDEGLTLEPLPQPPEESESERAVPKLDLAQEVPAAPSWYNDWRVLGGAGLLLSAGVVAAVVLSLPDEKPAGPAPDLDFQLCGDARDCSPWLSVLSGLLAQ